MFARLSRTIFTSATRCPSKSVPLSVVRVSRRTMSTTSHAPTKSSDTPWLIGSLVVFGPALLYLLSPSARKNTHGVHNDHHDFPALKQHEEHEAPKAESVAVPVEDGEGTEANAASSITPSQNDSTSSESQGEILVAVETEEVPANDSKEPATTPEVQDSKVPTKGNDLSGTSQEKGEEVSTSSPEAEKSAKE